MASKRYKIRVRVKETGEIRAYRVAAPSKEDAILKLAARSMFPWKYEWGV